MLRLGDKGPAVRTWQAVLFNEGARIELDGDFGTRTHNATLAYQARHGLPTTGVVDSQEWDTAAELTGRSIPPPPELARTIPLVMARFYRQPRREAQSRDPRRVIRWIVLHSMEAPEASSTAERCAAYFANMPPGTPREKQASAHYCVDSDSVVQCVPDHLVAFHARGLNEDSIGIEHAGFARQTREEWLDDFGRRMLGLSVALAARLCARYSIPPVIVGAAELIAGRPGIITHSEVNLALSQSSHSDPGPGFPLDWYGERVAALLVTLNQGNV